MGETCLVKEEECQCPAWKQPLDKIQIMEDITNIRWCLMIITVSMHLRSGKT